MQSAQPVSTAANSTGSRKDRRIVRGLLVFPKFQLMLIAINLGIIIGIALLIWNQTENALSDLRPAAGLSGFEVDAYRRYIDYQTNAVRTSLFISLFSGAFVSTFMTLLISHRVLGPLVRLRNYFSALAKGGNKIHPLEFRDGDYLSDLPGIVNEALRKVTAKNGPTLVEDPTHSETRESA